MLPDRDRTQYTVYIAVLHAVKVQAQRLSGLIASADAPGNCAAPVEFSVHGNMPDGVGVLPVKEHPERAGEVSFLLRKTRRVPCRRDHGPAEVVALPRPSPVPRKLQEAVV